MGRTSTKLKKRAWTGNEPLERLFLCVPDHYGYCLLRHLKENQRVRFSQLQTLLDVNSRTLTTRLRQLERFGLIIRTRHRTMPPRVDYALTEKGYGLAGIVDKLERWAKTHCQNAPAARQSARRRLQ